MKIVIVGGVAGGASAAARARRLSEDAEIILFERGPDVSFANCGLPYHIGEIIERREKLLVVTPQRLKERLNLDVRTRCNVQSINREVKTVSIFDLQNNNSYEESYDKLILAPGAAPVKPSIPGIENQGIYTLRNLQDMDRIKKIVDTGIKRAVVVGAGFIGLELVENLIARGIQTTLIELQDQVLPPLDFEMTTPLAKKIKEQGVELILGDSAHAFTSTDSGIDIHLKSGKVISADLVTLGIGVRPENQLAVDAGLSVGTRGGIQVNQFLQTSDPDIFAVGDAIEVDDFVLNSPTQIPLAGPANRQGRIAADNLFGRKSVYRGTQGTAILGMFKMVAATTGASEKILLRNSIPYDKVYIHPGNHAGYYPGAQAMSLKLLFDPESGKILGAQAVGGVGVDKRIDILSVAIQAGMNVYDLEEMELAYAPQFGSAKDPINMLGFVAAGLLRGDHLQVHVSGLADLVEEHNPLILDVRTANEFDQGHIPAALNIPVDQLRQHLHELPKGRLIITYCKVGQRGYIATRILNQCDFQAKNLSGGFTTYQMYHQSA